MASDIKYLSIIMSFACGLLSKHLAKYTFKPCSNNDTYPWSFCKCVTELCGSISIPGWEVDVSDTDFSDIALFNLFL